MTTRHIFIVAAACLLLLGGPAASVALEHAPY